GVIVTGTVEGGGDDLPMDVALHVRGVFGPLVDEHHHEVDVRVGNGDPLSHLGEELQALDPRVGRYQYPLAQRQRGEDVNDLLGGALRSQPEERLWVHRGERIELRSL